MEAPEREGADYAERLDAQSFDMAGAGIYRGRLAFQTPVARLPPTVWFRVRARRSPSARLPDLVFTAQTADDSTPPEPSAADEDPGPSQADPGARSWPEFLLADLERIVAEEWGLEPAVRTGLGFELQVPRPRAGDPPRALAVLLRAG